LISIQFDVQFEIGCSGIGIVIGTLIPIAVLLFQVWLRVRGRIFNRRFRFRFRFRFLFISAVRIRIRFYLISIFHFHIHLDLRFELLTVFPFRIFVDSITLLVVMVGGPRYVIQTTTIETVADNLISESAVVTNTALLIFTAPFTTLILNAGSLPITGTNSCS
jgi:hypothetical protein